MDTVGYVKFELEKTQKALQDYKNRYEKLQQENKQITEDRERIKQDSEEIIEYLRNTNNTKEKTIEKLKQDIGLQKDSFVAEKSEVKNTLEKQIKDLQSSLLEYEVQVQTLQADLDIVQDFKKQRASLLQELEENKKAMEELTHKSKEKVAKLERKYFEEKVRLQKEVATKLAEMKKDSEHKAVEQLGNRTRSVMTAHTQLLTELQQQQQASLALKHDQSKRSHEAEVLRQELALARGRLKEYAYLTHKQGKEIEGLTAKVKTLETALSNPPARPSPSPLQEQLVDSRLDIDALKRLLHIKSMELRKIRSLAQEIINQRSDLEQYFHDSLEHVKAEKLRQLQQQKNKSTASVKLKEAEMKRQRGEKVRLEDLSWEERERVLRILFSKINSSQSIPRADQEEEDSEEEMETRGGFDYDKYYNEQYEAKDQEQDEHEDQLEQEEEQEQEQEQEQEKQEEQEQEEHELEPYDDLLVQEGADTGIDEDELSKYVGMVSGGDFPPLA